MTTKTTMRALTITPGVKNSLQVEEFKVPPASRGSVLVRAVALGICGTDHEIMQGEYGQAPPGHERLILGHESLGRVEEAPDDSGLKRGDLVVGIVRHPDPVPCENCAVGEWDMCRNEQYTEHGIKGLDGYGSEYWRVEPQFAVPVDESLGLLGVLLEPTTIVAKAWEHTERIGKRARWSPRRLLVTGAGPVGLLAALLGAQRNLEIDVLDRAMDGPKPALAKQLGARYHTTPDDLRNDYDVVMECTGAPSVIVDSIQRAAPDGITCLAGVSHSAEKTVDIGELNREVVLGNRVIFGSVNANRRHYEAAIEALAKADPAWLHGVITRRVPLDRWREAFEYREHDVKTVVLFSDPASA
jgi:threonine dehydrogenase-like Zn-dependent dehydrogenase